MSTSALAALPIFRSDLQAQILFDLFSADGPRTTPELIISTRRPQPTVSREVSRLIDSGLLKESRVGNTILVEPDESNPAVRPLRALVNIALGPQEYLRQALGEIKGIEYAAIFGSFAARSQGMPGTSPGDIDLLIVGNPVRQDVYRAISDVQDRVVREINITFLSHERWANGQERIVEELRSKPIIELIDA